MTYILLSILSLIFVIAMINMPTNSQLLHDSNYQTVMIIPASKSIAKLCQKTFENS